ncbi:S8 family peptidase [Nocardia crassostreae]|uniref:S8 family peptidase n=1 Tax=Nocardia crassostreae TaxID=53428 RepID=UPI00083587C8|nr:S8 family peptidase [Nocardia crassostreae]
MSGDRSMWDNRVHCALGELSTRYIKITEESVLTMVAARFASRFEAADRLYTDKKPNWHHRVRKSLEDLTTAGLVREFHLTEAGERALGDACERARRVEERPLTSPPDPRERAEMPIAGVLTPPLRAEFIAKNGGGRSPDPIPVMIELNLRYRSGPSKAMARVKELWRYLGRPDEPRLLADEYAVGELTTTEIEGLISADAVGIDWIDRSIYRIWPDFPIETQIDASARTIKATAAQRAFSSFGDGIVWAVIDSGIQGDHPHFRGYHTLDDPTVIGLHKDFTGTGSDPLMDEKGHGTHVAGIIAGGLELWEGTTDRILVTERRFNVAEPETPIVKPRPFERHGLAGIAPRAKLVSLKVLGGRGTLDARTTRVIEALAYVREINAASGKLPRIQGVNLSLGYEFDPEWFACGRSPLCLEVDKLVRSGVVVVVAAGNSAYITLNASMSDVRKFSAAMTINDPGNVERAITVGSTHKDSPHSYGISYFSSRGPTADGRNKPDLVAPGERIAAAAAGDLLRPVANTLDNKGAGMAVYIEDSGTSMAAPHVSGAAAAFLSVQREFIGDPEAVKRILVSSATSLCRDRAFQGGGLVDLMRALQSV